MNIKRITAMTLAAAMTASACPTLAGCKNEEEAGFASVSKVTLSDAYAVNAVKKELEYLLSLDGKRLLADFRTNAGLPANATPYGGGWEGALIGGHTMGHYLSALAKAYANAMTPEAQREAVKERIDTLIEGLKECQEHAASAGASAGFLWGAHQVGLAPEAQFDNVERGKTNIVTEAWVPWYTMHKLIAGLIDVAEYTGSKAALGVVKGLGDWVVRRTEGWDEVTRLTVLDVEYGGMNDCMYNLYRLTGEQKYAIAAHAFDEEALFEDILSERDNYLNDVHANTTIPKIIGALNRYLSVNGKKIGGQKVEAERCLEVAEKFWERVLERHTYITGGNSEWEHFGLDNVLDAERTNANCETCNVYNMLKLSRMLFAATREKKYLDYYENAYLNDIWASQNPETGMTTYFQSMATGYFKVYSTPTGNFWCCTGSGMENFTKLNDSIYFLDGNTVTLSLYLSSTLETDKAKLSTAADLENSDTVTVHIEEGSFELRLRIPDWAESFEVTVDGRAAGEEKDGFYCLPVEGGNTVTVTMKKAVKAYNLPDSPNTYAFKYGPYVLAAELGEGTMSEGTTGVNVTVPANADMGGFSETVKVKGSVQEFMASIGEHLQRGADGKFRLSDTDQALVYSYYFRQHTERYGIYFKFTEGAL